MPDREQKDRWVSFHRPVLAEAAVDWLATRGDGSYLDGTVGGGGHLELLLDRLGPTARVLGLDRDPQAIEAAGARLGDDGRLRLRQGLFGDLVQEAEREGMLPLDGILLDLGVSSRQLDDPSRGFTYREDAPLDMRMDPGSETSAADLLASCTEEELIRIFREGGEVPGARGLARAVADARRRAPVVRSGELTRLVEERAPARRRVKVLSQLFQALRIEVNDELGQLEAALTASLDALRPGGRMVVIAYHSLEDRRVKQFFVDEARGCTCPPDFPVCACGAAVRLRILTRRVVRASQEEISVNPRARSARLRAAERTMEHTVEEGEK